jgi:group I intron endonuclease
MKIYNNVDLDKAQILLENKGKSGVYCFTNLINEMKYIGSAINLRSRFMQYFNPNYLERKNNMFICRALLKRGYSDFSSLASPAEILEYCEPEQCIDREDFLSILFEARI